MKRSNIALSVVLLILALSSAKAEFASDMWQYYAPVEGAKAVSSQYATVAITRDVYAKASPGLADIRIVSSDGIEVPYKVLVDEKQTNEKAYSPNVLNRSVVTGKFSSFDLDLGKAGILTNSVDLQTYSENFMRRVEIDASEDGATWAVLRSDGSIFDFSKEYHSQRLRVAYPQTTFRYIRVKVWNYDQRPLEIVGLSLAREYAQSAHEELLFTGKGKIAQNPKEKSTDILLDLGAKGLQARRIAIVSPNVNFDRTVEVAGSDDQREWMDVSGGQILRYDTPRFKDKSLSIGCDGGGFRYLRVRIKNYDDQPIQVSRVEVYGIRHRLFFKPEPGKNYKLYYGRKDVSAPVYDIEETFKYVSSEKTVALKLGGGVDNPQFVMPIASAQWLEQNPWVLWAVLGATVILLGILTAKSIIATKQMTPKQ